jgi:hypothetical protein
VSTILKLFQATGLGWGGVYGKYWVDQSPVIDPWHHYFREGHDTLFERSPTWFNTKEEAIAAAEAMGFMVIR